MFIFDGGDDKRVSEGRDEWKLDRRTIIKHGN